MVSILCEGHMVTGTIEGNDDMCAMTTMVVQPKGCEVDGPPPHSPLRSAASFPPFRRRRSLRSLRSTDHCVPFRSTDHHRLRSLCSLRSRRSSSTFRSLRSLRSAHRRRFVRSVPSVDVSFQANPYTIEGRLIAAEPSYHTVPPPASSSATDKVFGSELVVVAGEIDWTLAMERFDDDRGADVTGLWECKSSGSI
ncbi:PAS domain S-box protein [Sesbania bispinosa]|nr:PAS domain S-box protein [Sesbania bispinosa]